MHLGQYQVATTELNESANRRSVAFSFDQIAFPMPLHHRVTLPVTNETPIIDLGWAMLDTSAIRYLAESRALGMSMMFATPFRLAQVLPEIGARGLITPDHRINPLMADAHAVQGHDKTADLLWVSFLTQATCNGGDHTG